MTKKEAIELLEDLDGAIEDSHGRDYDKAFRMAIEALSAEEEKENGTFVNRDNCNFNCNDSNRTLVDVVRCKDCIHYESDESVCRIDDMVVDRTDYCSYGERKGGEDE